MENCLFCEWKKDKEKIVLENEIKDSLKYELGMERLIENVSYVIDGNQSTNEVFRRTKQFIEEQLI